MTNQQTELAKQLKREFYRCFNQLNTIKRANVLADINRENGQDATLHEAEVNKYILRLELSMRSLQKTLRNEGLLEIINEDEE